MYDDHLQYSSKTLPSAQTGKPVCRETASNVVRSAALLVNLPASTTTSMQRVQNDAARLILGLDRRAHITPALKKLRWLPIQYRIQ